MAVRTPIFPAILLSFACASAPPPEPAWWGESAGGAHVIHGGRRADREKARTLVTIAVPGDWRDRLQVIDDGGTHGLDESGWSVEFIAPDSEGLGDSLGGARDGVFVVSEREPRAMRTAHEMRATGAEVYLVRQERDGDVLRVEICGLDGWPLEPVPRVAFDWEATELELRGWRPDPWRRAKKFGQVVGFLALAGALIWGVAEEIDRGSGS